MRRDKMTLSTTDNKVEMCKDAEDTCAKSAEQQSIWLGNCRSNKEQQYIYLCKLWHQHDRKCHYLYIVYVTALIQLPWNTGFVGGACLDQWTGIKTLSKTSPSKLVQRLKRWTKYGAVVLRSFTFLTTLHAMAALWARSECKGQLGWGENMLSLGQIGFTAGCRRVLTSLMGSREISMSGRGLEQQVTQPGLLTHKQIWRSLAMSMGFYMRLLKCINTKCQELLLVFDYTF